MQPVDRSGAAAVNRFLHVYLRDQERGGEQPLAHYQAAFPEHAEAIAAEFERLSGRRPPHSQPVLGTTRIDEVGARIGPYVLERELGRGGQGAVFLAEDSRLGRRVALKLLTGLGSWSPSHLERFHREASLASRLDHPGLCTVYESDTVGGVPYVALRYVEGETLAERLANGGSFKHDQAARITESAARALHVAHEAGIVHRDVKPSNLMLTPSHHHDDDVVVLDFGLAREVEADGDSLTLTGDVFGTPAYMAPEQVEPSLGRPDARTDVWALGVTLFESLTGSQPFRSPTREGLYRSILAARPELPLGLPRDLRVILETALAPEPARRYGTALDLAEDLCAFREGRAIAARPMGPFERLANWARQNRGLAVSSCTAALLLVLGSLGTSLGWLRSVEKQNELAIAKADAEETAARALAMNRFLNTMVRSPDPLHGLGGTSGDITLAAMLDNASESIAGAFLDRPEVEAETRILIGLTYKGLGRLTDAETHYRAALDILSGLHDANHVDVLRTRRLLANAWGSSGRLDEAIVVLEEILPRVTAAVGPDHVEAAWTNGDLGWALLEAGRFREAEPYSRKALEYFSRAPEHTIDLATNANNLAMSLRASEDFAGAEAAYRTAIDIFRETYGEGYAFVGAVKCNLAFLLDRQGRADEALELYDQSVDTLRRAVGEHPILGSALLGRAKALYTRGDWDAALGVANETIEVLKNTQGEEHEEYGIAVELRGFLFSYLERHDEAAEAYVESARLLRSYHDDPDRALISEAWAAESRVMAGDVEAGEKELARIWEAVLVDHSPEAPTSQAVVRTCLRVYDHLARPKERAEWKQRLR